MKKVIAIIALAALASSSYAQLATLPPLSTTDGVNVQAIGNNAGATHWEKTNSGLADYKFASDATLGTPDLTGADWKSSSTALIAGRNKINNNAPTATSPGGGIIRGIFLGESAGWYNHFGYTYDGKSQSTSSYTVFKNIQAVTTSPLNSGIAFGQYVDISLGFGAAANFDFWLDAVGVAGIQKPVSNTTYGGVYTVFDQVTDNVKIKVDTLKVSTWVESLQEYQDIDTYIVGFEDWNLKTADKDYNDFMFAVQFLKPSGEGFGPVPEPSTYGLIGAVALLGLVVARRFKTKK